MLRISSRSQHRFATTRAPAMTMKKPRPSRPPTLRLIALTGALLLAAGALVAQRLWFSPAAREAQLSKMSLDQLEREASGGAREPRLYYELARRLTETGDVTGAEAALQTTLRLDPSLSRARATLATLMIHQGRDQEAVLQLQQAVKDDPSSVDAYLALGLLFQRQQSWHRMAQASETATSIHSENADAWMQRGQAAVSLRDPARAAEYFERASRLAPSNPLPHQQAAAACLSLGELDRAEKHAREAIRAAPRDPSGYLALGQVLQRRDPGHLQEAAQSFEESISLGEPTGAGHLGLGQALQKQRRYAEAEQQFQLAIHDNRTLNDARYGLARVLRAQGREEDAAGVEREFQAWSAFQQERLKLNDQVALHPDDVRAWFALARLHARMGLWTHAKRYAQSGLNRAPADAEGLQLMKEISAGQDRNAGG